jgi:hypothetical protein
MQQNNFVLFCLIANTGFHRSAIFTPSQRRERMDIEVISEHELDKLHLFLLSSFTLVIPCILWLSVIILS